MSIAPRSRRKRTASAIVLLLLSLPLATWFAAILVSIAYSGFVATRAAPSRLTVCWVGNGSTVVRSISSDTQIIRAGWSLDWQSRDAVVSGQVIFNNLSPDAIGIQVTHTVALPTLFVAMVALGVLGYGCVFRRHRDANQCASCGYSTAGLTSGTCPECAAPLSPASH